MKVYRRAMGKDLADEGCTVADCTNSLSFGFNHFLDIDSDDLNHVLQGAPVIFCHVPLGLRVK